MDTFSQFMYVLTSIRAEYKFKNVGNDLDKFRKIWQSQLWWKSIGNFRSALVPKGCNYTTNINVAAKHWSIKFRQKMTSCVEYCTYIHAVKFWAVTVCLKDKINVFWNCFITRCFENLQMLTNKVFTSGTKKLSVFIKQSNLNLGPSLIYVESVIFHS